MTITNKIKELSKEMYKEVVVPVVKGTVIATPLFIAAYCLQPSQERKEFDNKKMFYEIDANKDGAISFNEWSDYQNRPRTYMR